MNLRGLFIFLIILLPIAQADNRALPNPLRLEQALTYAKQHPASGLTPPENQNIAFTKPLYLNCHNLAYSNAVAIDYQRDIPFTQLVDPETAQQLRIMQYFLDVQLADLSVMADNESMAIAYVRLDRAQNRMELKQVSEVQVAELEARYQDTLQRYKASSELQHLTRTVLAQALAHPGQLPRDLKNVPPIQLPKELPEANELLKQARNHNNWLMKQRDNYSNLLWQMQDMLLRQYITELLSRLSMLKAAQQRLAKTANWRDLLLEENRTLYEQEVKSDLGDSMAEQTRVQFQIQQISFCQMLTWARLNALQGKPLLTHYSISNPAKTKTTP